MSRHSLSLGVNAPDPHHYGPRVRPLRSAERDAEDWGRFLAGRGWDASTVTGQQATTGRLTSWVEATAARPDASHVVITWSGHGTQTSYRDRPPGAGEPDASDELLVMHDRLFLDDELVALMSLFGPGVRVVLVLDCCHSGGLRHILPTESDRLEQAGLLVRRVFEDGSSVVARNRQLYQQAWSHLQAPTEPRAQVLGLAACQENMLAYEGGGHGHFTLALLDLLGPRFSGSFYDLVAAAAKSTPYQRPRPFWYAEGALLHERVFL